MKKVFLGYKKNIAGDWRFIVLLCLHLPPHPVTTLASSAFLASTASRIDLQSQLLLNCHHAPVLMSARPSCCGPPLVTYRYSMIPVPLNNTPFGRASRTATIEQGYWLFFLNSSNWLLAFPVISCGTRLDNKTIWLPLGWTWGSIYVKKIFVASAHWQTARQHTVYPASIAQAEQSVTINSMTWSSKPGASITSVKEPASLSCSFGRCHWPSRPLAQ